MRQIDSRTTYRAQRRANPHREYAAYHLQLKDKTTHDPDRPSGTAAASSLPPRPAIRHVDLAGHVRIPLNHRSAKTCTTVEGSSPLVAPPRNSKDARRPTVCAVAGSRSMHTGCLPVMSGLGGDDRDRTRLRYHLTHSNRTKSTWEVVRVRDGRTGEQVDISAGGHFARYYCMRRYARAGR